MKTARWEKSAIAWLKEATPPPVPPDEVVMGLAAAGVYHFSSAGAARRKPRSYADSRNLASKRNSQMRTRWKRRIRKWLGSEERLSGRSMEIEVGVEREKSWAAEIERRESGLMKPLFTSIEYERLDEIHTRKKGIYRQLVHHHDGAEWLW